MGRRLSSKEGGVTIRRARLEDFSELYKLGKNTPELQVSSLQPFMNPKEFRWSLTNSQGIFLVAERKDIDTIVGFLYATLVDIEKPFPGKYACLFYLVVLPSYRGRGIARALYQECENQLKTHGIRYCYGWARKDGLAIRKFLKRQGFREGHSYLWVEKKL